MFKTIIKTWKVPEVRKRILFTILLLIIFRFGTHVSVPFVNFVQLNKVMQDAGQGILGLVNLITGGAFARLSLFALSISPYISASIIVQLLGMLIPSLEMMMKEGGEQGKQKVSRLTKIITFAIALLQSIGLYIAYSRQGIFMNPSFVTGLIVVLSFMAGTSFLVWLGEKITKIGMGNGISVLIFAGIVASVPSQLIGLITKTIGQNGQIDIPSMITAIAIFVGVLLLITAVVYVHIAERKIPIQYSRKIVGRKMFGGQNTFIPIKPVMAGVMPVIFASSFITFPAMIIQIFFANKIGTPSFANFLYNLSVASSLNEVGIGYVIGHAVLFMLLIIGFTFFYTLAMYNPAEISANIRQNGGFIPGVRAGQPTTDFISNVIIRLTTFGSLFLCLVAVIPMFARIFTSYNIAFGGTSVLIVVGVALEIAQQLQSQLMMRHYKGFLE